MTYSVYDPKSIPPLMEVALQSRKLSRQKDGGCPPKTMMNITTHKHPTQNHLNNDFDLPSKGEYFNAVF